MSTIRDPAVITNAGRQMITAGGDISYTKAVLYGQDISHLTQEQLVSLTSIGNPLMTVPVGISDKNNAGANTTVVLEATYQNTDLKVDLPYTAVGFFAKRGDDAEKLVIVGVANAGAYLAAASPDGVATDALDIKVAIAIGDATDVTAVIDPAGSVTPATLNGAINKATHDLTAKIDTKADKTDVTAQFATKADKTTVEQELTTKANASDVYTKKQVDDALSSRDTAIATKADKATVDAEISKIDFTPYAKTADVNKQIKTVTDLANSKVSADYSYSKAELDKKLLAVTTDTSGKVNANQVASMIADKADKTYVDNQIATIDFGKIKFRKQYVNSDGQTADKTWSATKNQDGTYTIDLWQDDWTASKLSGVLAQLPNKADTTTVNAQIADAKNTIKSNVDNLQSAVNTKASQADFDSLKTLVNNVKSFNVNSFKGSIPTTDINKITDSGLYGFANQTLTNSPFSGNRWGLLLVLREYDNDANNIDQFITSNGNLYWRNISLSNNSYPSWKRFVNDGDINSLQNIINQQNQTIQSLTTRLTNAENEINYIKANYIEGKRFAKADESQATAWEKENSQRIAFITDN